LKIAVLSPAGYAVGNRGDGRKSQIISQIRALRTLGHDITELNPFIDYDLSDFDALHVVEGGFGNYVGYATRITGPRTVGFAPFIDSNQPNWAYRLRTWLGSRSRVFLTASAVHRRQMLLGDLVIARSSHERQRIIHGLGVDPKKVLVEIVLCGVAPPAHSDPERARAAYNLPREYLLHVGAWGDKRKNTERLIQAVDSTNLPLVIAGNPCGAFADHVRAAAARVKNVHLLEFQSPEMLASLYAGCKVFCLPSLHEGAGLVALEAAANGAGVVITPNGGPPDYFRSLAHYANPFSVTSIRSAILKAWENPQRREIQQHVLTNLTWEHSAQALVDAYQRAAAHRAARVARGGSRPPRPKKS
jgi:glycosyltransferase involved in cell wall biosynthesis